MSYLTCSRITALVKNGAAVTIDDASAADTLLSVKERVFAANRMLPVHRQELVYSDGPRGIEALADDETLGGAGVAQDGTAEFDVQLTSARKEKANKLGPKVWRCWQSGVRDLLVVELFAMAIVYQSHCNQLSGIPFQSLPFDAAFIALNHASTFSDST